MSLWTKLKKLVNSHLDKQQSEQPRCDNCFTLFVEEESILHINNEQILIYDAQDVSIPHTIVKLKRPNLFHKQILQAIHIAGTNLIAVMMTDLRMFIINYKQGVVERSLRNVNLITKLSDQCFILFGTNSIRTISKRTFKTVNQISTQFSSPVFTVDVHRNLIVAGSYWDIYLLDSNLQMKCTVLKAHNMSVLCVKFINGNTIASTSEDNHLNLWQVSVRQENNSNDLVYSLTLQQQIYLSHVNANNITVSPFNKYSLLLNSNTYITYVLFNQAISDSQSQISYPQLRYQLTNAQIDQSLTYEKSSEIYQIKINYKKKKFISTFKNTCQLYSSIINKTIIDILNVN